MGLLNFLNKRPSVDVNSDSIAHQGSTMAAPSRPGSQGIRNALGNNPRTSEERPQSSHSRSNIITEGSSSVPVKPRLVGITEGHTIDCRDNDESMSQQKRPKSSRRNQRDASRGLTINTGFSNAGDKSPLKVSSPMSSSSGPQSRRPTAFVDILDATGELRTHDFRSRIHAAGAREYGEDVADRNMRENAIPSPLKSAHATSFGAPHPFRTHQGSDAQSLYTRLPSKDGLYTRRPSLAISLRQRKPSMTREDDDQYPAFVAKGSVRAAREALRAGGYAGVRAGRIQGPAPLLPHHKLENYYDWSRFNKSAWDDASSAHSDGPHPSSISRSSYRQGSFASSVPPLYEPYSPQTSGARSICRNQAPSVDLPHALFFREIKFGACSRSLRSRGGDSSIAPDEDSCGDSVFISPATPIKDGSLGLLSGRRFKGGFNLGGFESTAIYDSDTESRLLRPDGETLLSKDYKELDEFFDKADDDEVPTPRWAETPLTPIEIYELGNNERLIAGDMARHRKNTRKPFTQRERMLALGYDYDSDSDVEASVDSDEMPEERALKLLNSLIGSGGSSRVRGKDEQAANMKVKMKVNMNTVAKLRREIRKRRRTGAAGRRFGPSQSALDLSHQGDESRNETIS